MRIVAHYLLFGAIATTGCGQQAHGRRFCGAASADGRATVEPRGIKDERVLAAMAKVPRESLSRRMREPRVQRWAAAHRLRSDHFPAIHGGVYDGTAATETERPRVRNRERFGLSGGDFSRARDGCLHDRNRRATGKNCRSDNATLWDKKTCISRSATVTKAGPKRGRSMRLS